jgi:hypothetical protein
MVDAQKIPWKRLSVEAAAIVGSILLAFAIDAWWEDRIERQAEQWLLERLRADFVEIRLGLEIVEVEHQEASDACIALLNLVAAGEPLPMTPEVDTMVARVFIHSRTFNPGSGAVAVFLNSDASKQVRNQPLADLLVKWSGLVEELQEEEAQLQKGVSERWTPYLASRTSLGPYIKAASNIMLGLPDDVSTPAQRAPVVVDSDFVNHILNRFTWQQIALRDVGPLHEAVREILELLETEVGA